MAMRHFSSNGLPKLDEITSEITEYFTDLPTKYTHIASEILIEKKFGENIDFFNLTEEDLIVMALTECLEEVPKNSVQIDGIYIIGSQAEQLPDNYLLGNHDLDIIIKSNIHKVVKNPDVRNLSILLLKYHMNDRYGVANQPKEGFLDIIHEESSNRLKKPYLQID
jgi:hypothetical protein